MKYTKICIVCNNEFKARIDHKITCSDECRKIYSKKYHENLYYSNNQKFDGKCKFCQNDIPNFEQNKKLRYCSKHCESKFNYKNQKIITKVCILCNKEFSTNNKKVKVCSAECKHKNLSIKTKHDDVEKNCPECGNNFKIAFTKRNDRIFCSRHCALVNMHKKLDKEEQAKKQSEAMKKKFASGYKHCWIGRKHKEESKEKSKQTRIERGLNKPESNPMYGKIHSQDSKEKMSKTRTKMILSGKYNSWFKKGTFESNKTNSTVIYQSSWEKKFIEHLENDDNVLFYKSQPFSIQYFYLQNRNYIPDIHVIYKNGINKIIEVKPLSLIDAQINIAKFAAANKFCEEKGYIFEVWTQKSNPYNEKFNMQFI